MEVGEENEIIMRWKLGLAKTGVKEDGENKSGGRNECSEDEK